MKKILFLATLILCTSGGLEIYAQTEEKKSPKFSKMDVSPLDLAIARADNKEPIARVLYSRPQKRDREVFGKLVPYGEVWRTGANETTELTLYTDMTVAGKTIKAGTYSLYTIPEENEWTVILNNSTNTWGAYDYHVEEDMARIEVPVRKLQKPIEELSMAFETIENGTKLQIGWDNRYVEVPFQHPEE